jgi:homeobox protein cut-like
MALEKSQQLNETLEADLEKVQKEASNSFDAMSVAGTYTSRYPQSGYAASTRRGRSSPTSSIISGFDPAHSSPGPTSLSALRAGGGEPMGGGSGMLPMMTAQRDRYRKKIEELNSELQKSHTTISGLRSEVNALQKDNLDLYEKTRYVSSYNRSTGSSAYTSGGNGNPGVVNVGSSNTTSSGLTMDRYRTTYESNLSPFAAFRGRESARALKRMSVFERMVFRITRLVLATRTSRNLFALYCVGLHLLVFLMLYWSATADIEGSRVIAASAANAAAGGGPVAAGGADPVEWQKEGFQEGTS